MPVVNVLYSIFQNLVQPLSGLYGYYRSKNIKISFEGKFMGVTRQFLNNGH